VNENELPGALPSDAAGGWAALTGECTFYHGGKKGRPIPIQVRDEAHRVELLNGLCNDPEVEGFEIAWGKPPNDPS
jgi:hypothetical protein